MNIEQIKKDRAINTMVYYIATNLHDIFHEDYEFVYYTDENCCDFEHFVPRDKNSLIIPVEEFVDECAIEKYEEDDFDDFNLRLKSLDKVHQVVSFHYSRWCWAQEHKNKDAV